MHSSANERFHNTTSGSLLIGLQLNSTAALWGQSCGNVDTSASVCVHVSVYVCLCVGGELWGNDAAAWISYSVAPNCSKYVGKYRQSGSAGGAHVFSFSIQNYSNDIICTVQSTFTGKHHFLFRHDCALWKKQTPQRNVFLCGSI